MKILASLIVVIPLLLIVPFGFAQENMQPDLIVAERANFFPEGIEYDSEGERFLLGSLAEGTIFAVDDDGTVTPFIEDGDLVTTIGIHIDVAGNRLLVANTDPTVLSNPESDGNGSLGIYDLTTGERLHFIDLRDLLPEGKQLANDVTSDADGNAYVTDSFSPVIYKVDAEGTASILIENEALSAQPFGLNGIEYHPDGYILVAVLSSSSLYKIPLDDPESFTQVALDEPFSADGLVLHPNGDLIAVAVTVDSEGNPVPEVLTVSSNDGWASAAITSRVNTSEMQVTTAAMRDEAVYVIAAHLDEFFSDQSVDGYEIYRIDFEDDSDSAAVTEPCTISTDKARTVQVRVGYGENRTAITMLKEGINFEAQGQNTDSNDAVWYALDKEEAAPNKLIEGDVTWVASADIKTSGDCDTVPEIDASGIRPISTATPMVDSMAEETTASSAGEIVETLEQESVSVPTDFVGRGSVFNIHDCGGGAWYVRSGRSIDITHSTGGFSTAEAAMNPGFIATLSVNGTPYPVNHINAVFDSNGPQYHSDSHFLVGVLDDGEYSVESFGGGAGRCTLVIGNP